jgi:hypothetical protein
MEKPLIQPAGFAIPGWCEAADISRATFYNLPPELRPHSVKIRKRHIIVEAPKDYLLRIRTLQQAA